MSPIAACMQWNVPVRFTAIVRCHSSSVIVLERHEPGDGGAGDEDLDRARASARTCVEGAVDRGPVRHVDLHRRSPRRRSRAARRRPLLGGVAVEVEHGDAPAVRGRGARQIDRPEPGRAAGDDCDTIICVPLRARYTTVQPLLYDRTTSVEEGAWLRRPLLRPVRRRDRRRSVPDLQAAAGRGAALLQRAARLLGPEPLRRRRGRAEGLEAPQLGEGRHPRGGQGRPRHAAGRLHQRGPAAAHGAPRAGVAGVHAEADERSSRTRSGPSARRASTRSSAPIASTSCSTSAPSCRCGRSACCVGHPRRRAADGARPRAAQRCATEPGEPLPVDQGPLLRQRSVYADYVDVAGAEPVRRPHHRAAQRRVRRRVGRPPAADQGRAPDLPRRHRRRRRRDHRSPVRLDGQGARPSIPTSARAGRRPLARPQRDRGAAALRAARPARRPLRRRGRRVPRPDGAGGQRVAAHARVGEPRRAPLRRPGPLRHPPQRSAST